MVHANTMRPIQTNFEQYYVHFMNKRTVIELLSISDRQLAGYYSYHVKFSIFSLSSDL